MLPEIESGPISRVEGGLSGLPGSQERGGLIRRRWRAHDGNRARALADPLPLALAVGIILIFANGGPVQVDNSFDLRLVKSMGDCTKMAKRVAKKFPLLQGGLSGQTLDFADLI